VDGTLIHAVGEHANKLHKRAFTHAFKARRAAARLACGKRLAAARCLTAAGRMRCAPAPLTGGVRH
jgi:hypothetical protein